MLCLCRMYKRNKTIIHSIHLILKPVMIYLVGKCTQNGGVDYSERMAPLPQKRCLNATNRPHHEVLAFNGQTTTRY